VSSLPSFKLSDKCRHCAQTVTLVSIIILGIQSCTIFKRICGGRPSVLEECYMASRDACRPSSKLHALSLSRFWILVSGQKPYLNLDFLPNTEPPLYQITNIDSHIILLRFFLQYTERLKNIRHYKLNHSHKLKHEYKLSLKVTYCVGVTGPFITFRINKEK
jgi:hypothetical protein